jgi:hypothetical protein
VLKPFAIQSTMPGRPCHGGGHTGKQLPRLKNRKRRLDWSRCRIATRNLLFRARRSTAVRSEQ